MIFHSNYEEAKDLVKEIEEQGRITKQKSKSENENLIEINYNNVLIDDMIFMNYNQSNDRVKSFKEIIENNFKKKEYRTILFFFDKDANLINKIIDVIDIFYQNHIFIIIYTDKDVNNLRTTLEEAIVSNFEDDQKIYFDINNIIIFNKDNINTMFLSIIKIFSYYNQIGDGYFKEIANIMKIKDYEYLNKTHYFNIMLCGSTGVGKSTFINTFLEEKKAFINNGQSATTFRNNYYIHKKYPIKLIDCCGASGRNEGVFNNDLLNSIYNKNNSNILIDKYSSDIFNYFEDRRNDIHLLLYFNCYGGAAKSDINGEDEIMMKNALKKKIPIIFVINKCDKNLFKNKKRKERFNTEIKRARDKNPEFINCKTIILNCIDKNGFDELLSNIYEQFKNYIISEDKLEMLKNSGLNKKDLVKIFDNSFFFKNINPNKILIDKAIINSVLEIKELIVKIAGYYSKEIQLTWFRKYSFCWDIFRNYITKNTSNFFPLLVDLVFSIFKNFRNEKTKEESLNYIKNKLLNYLIKDELNDTEINFFLNNENNKNDYLNNNIENIHKENKLIDDNDDIQKYNKNSINYSSSNEFEQFDKNFKTLGELFYNIYDNFNVEQYFENYLVIKTDLETKKKHEDVLLLRKKQSIKDNIFDISSIKYDTVIEYIRKCLGLYKGEVNLSTEQKMKIKIFIIAYVCYKLISENFENIKKKGFEYKTICEFYYNVSISYNKAIEGFNEIKKELKT